jgi:hypothetical protein
MNRAPTWVRPAANEMPLCRDAVPTLPARLRREGTRGHGDMGARGDGSGSGVVATRAARGAAPTWIQLGAARWGVFQFASRHAVNFILVRCVGRLARPRYLLTERESAPFSFGVSLKEGSGFCLTGHSRGAAGSSLWRFTKPDRIGLFVNLAGRGRAGMLSPTWPPQGGRG